MVRKSYGHAILGLLEENWETKLRLVIMKEIERPKIKVKKITKFKSPILSIECLIEDEMESRGKLTKFASQFKMNEIKKKVGNSN